VYHHLDKLAKDVFGGKLLGLLAIGLTLLRAVDAVQAHLDGLSFVHDLEGIAVTDESREMLGETNKIK
jgi:hypothetical protein